MNNTVCLKEIISERVGLDRINEVLMLTQKDDARKQELYDLAVNMDDAIGYNAAWILTHFSEQDNIWLYNKHDELIDYVISSQHEGKRRCILTLLYKQPFTNPPRVDFLDFCFEKISCSEESSSVRSLCIKIAYELCLPIPELLHELKNTLEMLDFNTSPSIHSVRRNILKALSKGKSLRSVKS